MIGLYLFVVSAGFATALLEATPESPMLHLSPCEVDLALKYIPWFQIEDTPIQLIPNAIRSLLTGREKNCGPPFATAAAQADT